MLRIMGMNERFLRTLVPDSDKFIITPNNEDGELVLRAIPYLGSTVVINHNVQPSLNYGQISDKEASTLGFIGIGFRSCASWYCYASC